MSDKRICDRCDKFNQSPSGSVEICHAQKEGDQVCSPWINVDYRDDRFNGIATSCKGFRKIAV